ncbi:TonB-dependent receptor [Maricaulis parjimensis]|uniref:TonB-dependent receptor n=1 Tax=Maricaulis parjimensis TaxID=144023 RepID=UPI001EED499A|nr:TonB-dependent receptor [Maricaulis parjimensis]
MKLGVCQSLLAGASVIALVSGAAWAQDDDTAPRGSVQRVMDVITVTATKRPDAEDVQDVPVSVSAFNADTLDALNVRSLESLSFSAPNVSLDDIGTARGTANFSIRGLGVNSSIPSIDPTVGVFVDGVYIGVNNGLVFDMFDLDSVEILRGPQGLLFGRNTTGGAVLINTGSPTDELEAGLRIAIDGPIDDGRGGWNRTAQAYISGPIVEGRLNGRLAMYANSDDGYFTNLATGDDHGAADMSVIRGSLEWMPSDTVTFLGRIEFSEGSGDGPAGQNRGVYERDTFNIAIDEPGNYGFEGILGSLRTDIDVDFGNGQITNIFGYRSYETEAGAGDIDALPLFLFHSIAELSQEQVSNELRYAGTFGRADVTTGLYYFNQDLSYTEIRDLPPLSPLTFYGGGRQDHTVYGVFAQIDWNFTDNFIGTVGLRYSSEEKDAQITYIRPRPACSVVGGTCPSTGTNPFIPTENNGFEDGDEWSNVTPRLGFQYFFSDNTNVFGNYTRGFRSGGYNFRITAPAAFEAFVANTGSFSFDEESVDSYELGFRHQTEDGRGQISAGLYMTEIADMQREVNASSATSGVVQTILNTADATIRGLELEGRWALTDTLLLTGNLGLIDAEYDSVIYNISSDPGGLINDEDLALALPRVPETTWGIGLLHDMDLGDSGAVSTRVSFQHRDEIAYTDNNFGWVQDADMLSANMTWYTPWNGVALSVYGNNLLDEVQAGNDTQLPFGGSLAPFVPGGQNLSTGVNVPFGEYPAVGTFSPLKKGRVVGFELTIRR